MGYTFQFGVIAEYLPYFLGGAWVSLLLAFLAFWAGAVIGLLGAMGKTFGGPVIYRIVDGYVVFFTNTPALVQVYVIFYGLPDVGILLSPFLSVLIGLTLNSGAYLTEIQRAGFQSVRREELEAAEAMGMSVWHAVCHVIAPHIAKTLYAPLSNFYIWLILGTSMAGVFGVEELTGRAINVSASTFRTIEVFVYVAVIYVVLTVIASALLALIGRKAFRVKAKIF